MATESTDSSLRIVLASSQKGWGGGEVYLTSLAKELRSRGVRVEFLVRANTTLHKYVRDEKFPFRTFRGRGRSPLQILRLRRWLSNQQPLTLHCNDTHALLAAGIAAYGLKSVSVVAIKHTMFPVRSPKKYVRLANRVICVSNAVADLCHEHGIPSNHLNVIHPGIAQPEIDQTEAESLRNQFLPEDKKYLVVAVGNLLSCKGHNTLIEAASELKTMGIRAQTIIAGEGKERETLESQIESLGLEADVRLLGFREDANALIAAADVVAHPALNEGLCLTVAAAMMLKRPVVATAVGGLNDVLGIDQRMSIDGPYASTFAVGDVIALAHKLRDALIAPPTQELLAVAQDYAINHFTTLPMADATLELYRDLSMSKAA